MARIVFISVFMVLLSACASAPHHGPVNPARNVSDARVDISGSDTIGQVLNQQYKDWRHVKHTMGGTSRKGVDCSGLVYQTYRTKFGVAMPRSTEQQSKMGQAVKKGQLKAGDLVFFKTGVFTRHVGMYIDEGNFLHVSSSKGVMISNLDERYWKRAYWKARRVL